jgi:hypothetical protein
MVFDPSNFVSGVEEASSAVTRGIEDVSARIEERIPYEEASSAVTRGIEDVNARIEERIPDVVRAGGVNVFDPYDVDQIIVDDSEEEASVLSIRRPDGEILCATDHFILTSVNEPDQEKMSFSFSLGEPVLFGGVGRRPRVFSYSGFLKDSRLAGPGISAWREIYERYLRGERCVQLGASAVLEYRDQYREGYIMSTSLAYESSRPTTATFSFNLFLINRGPL